MRARGLTVGWEFPSPRSDCEAFGQYLILLMFELLSPCSEFSCVILKDILSGAMVRKKREAPPKSLNGLFSTRLYVP